jgi:basic membrane protein A and related proteins
MKRYAVSRTTTIISVVVVVILVAAALTYAVYISPSSSSAKKTKLALIMSGPADDEDYEALGVQTLGAIGTAFGLTTSYAENVNPADLGTSVSEYVNEGYSIIWTHGAEFASEVGLATNQTGVASQFPNVEFIVESDTPPPASQLRPNVWVINRNYIPGMFAMGVIAALSTNSGTIAYLGASKLPFSLAEANAIILAAHDYNSTVKVLREWDGDFFDVVLASTATHALVGQGADVIVNSLNLGYFGIVDVINNTHVLVTAKYTNKISAAPNNQISSLIFNFTAPLSHIYSQIKGGTNTGEYTLKFGVDNYVSFPLTNVPASVNTKVQSVVSQLESGAITVGFNTTDPGSGP